MSDDNSWEFFDTPGYFYISPNHPKACDAYWMYSITGCAKAFPATENGWISADHDPPTEGKYLVYSNEFGWGSKNWSKIGWQSCWHIQMWKPVLTPENPEEKDKYIICGVRGEGMFQVVESKSMGAITHSIPKDQAETITDALNGKEACQCS